MYKITIIKTEIKEVFRGQEWRQVRDEEDGDDGKYGYTPEIIKKEEVDTKVLEQTVEDLDLVEVIKAVNKIKEN